MQTKGQVHAGPRGTFALRRAIAAGATVLAALLLAACGGDDDAAECSGGQNVYATVVYDGSLIVNEGENVVRTARTPGVPGGCDGARQFSVTHKSVPPGMTLDARNGTLYGRPTTQGFYAWVLRLTIPGFTGDVSGYWSMQVHRPANYNYTGWQRGVSWPGMAVWLQATDQGLVVLREMQGFFPAEVHQSTDGGSTWTQMPSTNAPSLSRDAVSLGSGAYLYALDARKFHRYDGSAWTVQSTNAPGAGQMLVRLGARLFAVGGTFDRNPVTSAWTSDDDGVTWVQRSSRYLPTTDVAQCAFAVDGQVTVVARRNVAIGAYELAVWRTADGVTWTEVAVPATSALRASGDSGFVCATVGTRGYLTSSGGTVVSTANGSDWQFERQLSSYAQPSYGGGAAASGGTLHVLSGFSSPAVHRALR